jgi:hypothetical protein
VPEERRSLEDFGMAEEPKQEDGEAQGKHQKDTSWDKFKELFGKNPTLALTVLYLYATGMGILYSAALYGKFGINILDYSDTVDFLFAAFKNQYLLAEFGLYLLAFFLGIPLVWFVRTLILRLAPRESSDSTLGRIRTGPPRSTWLPIIVECFVFLTLIFATVTYDRAIDRAREIKDGKPPAVDVRYRSFSGSAGQVEEPNLRLIGATQKAVFFYDVGKKHALVIPQAQLVSIEVPE